MLVKFTNFKKLEENSSKLVVLLLGSIEQHGPFMPLGTDTLMGEALSNSLEEKLGEKIVIFPVLPFGAANEHKGFPGTITIETSTYMLFVKDVLNSIVAAGFKKILVISTHGGNDLIARVIQADFNYVNKTKVEYIFAFEGQEIEEKTIELFGGSEMHAGSSENSIIAALFPKAVSFMGIKVNKKFAPNREGAFTLFPTREMTDIGILNYSSKLEVDPKKGRELFDFIADKLCQRIEAIRL